MSSIHQRARSFELKWRENGHPKSKNFKKRSEAVERQRDVDRKLREGKPVMRRKDAPTLKDFGNEWLAGRKDLEPGTKQKYSEWLGVHIYPQLGHLSVVDLHPRTLGEWQKRRLAEGAGPAVLGKAQGLLSQILKKAVLPYEYLEQNPVLALDPPSYTKKPHRWLTAVEVEALRSWYLEREDLGSAALISTLAYVGIRPQDATARMIEELVGADLSVTTKNSDGVIVPGSKTGEGYKRRVKVPGPVQADFAEWIEGDSGLIWPRAKDGKPWTKNDWDNWRARGWVKQERTGKMVRPKCFKAAAEACGLGENLKPYDLRHTAGSLMAACGWTSAEIAHQLGHSVSESERTYRHLISVDGPRLPLDTYILEARGQNVRSVFGVEGK